MSPKDPYAVFRPRRGSLVARLSALAVLLSFGVLVVLSPGGGWTVTDRVLVFLIAVVLAVGLWRFGMVRAVPTPEGLRVVNLVLSRDVEWAEIVRVTFAGGTPWAVLELNDTEELAVMGIQRADGAFGRAEASRLAALVAHHSG